MEEQNEKKPNVKKQNEKKQSGVTQDFVKILRDFYVDIFTTFPECKKNVDKQLIIDLMEANEESDDVKNLYEYCVNLYPKKFFDILYENVDIFSDAFLLGCFRSHSALARPGLCIA